MILCQRQPVQLIALSATWVYNHLPAVLRAGLTVVHSNAIAIYATDDTKVKLKFSILAAARLVKAEPL